MEATTSKVQVPLVSILLGIAVFSIIVFSIVYGAKYIWKISSQTPTEANIKAIANAQTLTLTQRYARTFNNHNVTDLWKDVPEAQKLLINCSVQSCRLLGYLGPFVNGVFREDDAVQTALKTGSRLFTIEIGVDPDTKRPVLLYRDAAGFLVSLNKGSLLEVAKSLANRAFRQYADSSPPQVVTTPLILCLMFQETPDYIKKPADYIRFLAAVGQQLAPIQSMLLGQTAAGDFRRGQLANQLFFQPWNSFQNKIILLCNVNTRVMQSATAYGIADLPASQDLDLMVNARIFAQQEGSKFGATAAPSSTDNPAVVIADPSFFTNTPPDKLQDAINLTKSKFVICMNRDAEVSPDRPTLENLRTQYGVHSVPFVYFAEEEKTNAFVGIGAPYETKSYLAKGQTLRFVPPTPIVLRNASPATNANGGRLTAPTL